MTSRPSPHDIDVLRMRAEKASWTGEPLEVDPHTLLGLLMAYDEAVDEANETSHEEEAFGELQDALADANEEIAELKQEVADLTRENEILMGDAQNDFGVA